MDNQKQFKAKLNLDVSESFKTFDQLLKRVDELKKKLDSDKLGVNEVNALTYEINILGKAVNKIYPDIDKSNTALENLFSEKAVKDIGDAKNQVDDLKFAIAALGVELNRNGRNDEFKDYLGMSEMKSFSGQSIKPPVGKDATDALYAYSADIIDHTGVLDKANFPKVKSNSNLATGFGIAKASWEWLGDIFNILDNAEDAGTSGRSQKCTGWSSDGDVSCLIFVINLTIEDNFPYICCETNTNIHE